MSRQLQISMVVRERKNGCDEMVHQFELSEITKYGGLLDQACIRLAKGETETTYRALTPAKEKIIDDFTPMANAVEKLLKKLKEAQPMEKVDIFIDNKMKDTTDLKQFKDIRNDHFKKKNVKVRDRNEAFLKLFPNKFHLDMNKVGIAKDPPPLPHPEGLAFPYETKGWRDIGITAELAAEVCVLSGHPCLVMHNTTLIYQRYPEGWTYEKGRPMVCFNVWGDHGFFYQTSESNAISHMKVRVPPKLTERNLYNAFDEDIQTNFKDMREYKIFEEIEEAIDQKKSVAFWVTEIYGIQKQLEERRISFYPTWNDPPTSIRAITIYLPGKVTIRIRQVPHIAPIIQSACDLYTEKTSRKLEYKGESLGAWMFRGMENNLITKRIHAQPETIKCLMIQQEGKCSTCDELLQEGRFEVCHVIPRASSIGDEGNQVPNLTLKCKPCHNDENHSQDLSNQKQTGHTLASHPSPFLHYLFHWGGKPPQQVCGQGYDDPQIGKDVYELDARGSRPNAIFEYPYRIPIFFATGRPRAVY